MGDVEQMGDRASGVAAVTSRSDQIQRSGRAKGNERIRTSSAVCPHRRGCNIAPFLTQIYDQHAVVSATSVLQDSETRGP